MYLMLTRAEINRIERLQNRVSIPYAMIARRCVLGKDNLCYFPPWGQAVYPLWWPSLTKDMQTEQLRCWSGMTDTEHSTTSGSNEEEEMKTTNDKLIATYEILN